MIVTVEVAYNIEIVKVSKLTKMYRGKTSSSHAQFHLPCLCLVGYIHSFSCESSLQYGDCENSKTCQNFC